MCATPSRQQRLFTGALFPEALNDQLYAFAQRHHLHSNVWVPRRAFDMALKPYRVHILPHAALCDVSLTPGGGAADVVQAIGADRILVNAQYTSHPAFMEAFRDFLVCRLDPPTSVASKLPVVDLDDSLPIKAAEVQSVDGSVSGISRRNMGKASFALPAYFTAADPISRSTGCMERETQEMSSEQHSCPLSPPPIGQPDMTWDALPPFRFPLALNGSPLLSTAVSTTLLAYMQEHETVGNYWRRLRTSTQRARHLLHTGSGESPGRYNPFYCVRYVSHNYTGSHFPQVIAALMRHRAVDFGYVSRLWLTEQQGETLFGAKLRPERSREAPVIYSNYHTGGLYTLAYYCADQFTCLPAEVPTKREIDLAAQGVWLALPKLRAYPLLHRLQSAYAAEASSSGFSERVGTDVAMQDATRHAEFCKLTAAYEQVRLLGQSTSAKETLHLNMSRLKKRLRRQCVLCGYPTALFISHRELVRLGLQLQPGVEGVAQSRQPVHLPVAHAFTDGECWFNVAQLQEPAIGAELLGRYPRHFFTRTRIFGRVAARCCAAQIEARRRHSVLARPPLSLRNEESATPPSFSEWVPLFAVQLAGWKLRPGAAGVPYTPAGGRASFKSFPIGNNVLFLCEDIELDEAVVQWMRSYTPVDEHGHPFLRGMRQLLTLRAVECGYQSPLWYCYRQEDAAPPRVTLRTERRTAPTQPTAKLSDLYAFARPPFVRHRGFWFVNREELAEESLADAARIETGVAVWVEEGKVEEETMPSADEAAQRQIRMAREKLSEGYGVSAEVLWMRRLRSARRTAARSSSPEREADAFSTGSEDDEDWVEEEDGEEELRPSSL